MTAFYAVAKIGAVVVPIFSGFAANAVAARLTDAGAVAVITADAVPRKGRPVPMKPVVDDAIAELPAVHTVVVWDRLQTSPAMTPGRYCWRTMSPIADHSDSLAAPGLDPETPLMVIYTSGTTGKPKGAVHVHGGFLVKIAEECAFQTDVHADDRFMWVHRHGLDHGAVGGGGQRRAGRDPRPLRRRPRLPRARQAVGAGRASPGHRARRISRR